MENIIELLLPMLVAEMLDGAKEEVETYDKEIKVVEWNKFEEIMSLSLEKDEECDWSIDNLNCILAKTKLIRQFYIAITKKNWKLLTPIRKKFRESCDALMDNIEPSVEKGWYNESEYIKMANELRDDLKRLDDIIRHLGSFGVL